MEIYCGENILGTSLSSAMECHSVCSIINAQALRNRGQVDPWASLPQLGVFLLMVNIEQMVAVSQIKDAQLTWAVSVSVSLSDSLSEFQITDSLLIGW